MKILGHHFQDPKLLRAAITHRSSGGEHNERLEFLGDSILNFVIAAELYARFPTAREGDLTRLRSGLVRGLTLAEIARELKLGEYLSLGVGERRTGGFQRDSILADALEALIGALYLDANLEVSRTRILDWYKIRIGARWGFLERCQNAFTRISAGSPYALTRISTTTSGWGFA
jgi:ribonuclease III